MRRFSRLLRSNSLLEERLLFPTNFPIPFSPNYYLWKIRYVVLLVLSFFLSWKKWKGKWKFSKRAQFLNCESLPRIGISSIIAWNRLRMALVVGEAWDGVESRAIIGSNFCLSSCHARNRVFSAPRKILSIFYSISSIRFDWTAGWIIVFPTWSVVKISRWSAIF